MKRKGKKLTLQEREFCQKFVETKNGTEAAMQVYNVKNRINAGNVACAVQKRPKVREEIERILAANNITEETIAQKYNEGANANIVVHDGLEAIETNIPDHKTRHNFLRDQAEMLGVFPDKTINTRNINIDLELEKMPPKELAVLLKNLAQQIYGESDNKEKFRIDTGGNEDSEENESQG